MQTLTSSPIYQTQRLDHLGLVSGIFRDLGLVGLLDGHIQLDERSKLSAGQLVLAMVINGLGFTTHPMYLSPQFFSNKPLSVKKTLKSR